ncbi:hypothetical protein [Paenibacillus xylanexedens]|uniref:hypothetical protein n=1 Tax=Paenibacillus xylanexedens TaxID=528191 RepID=UPI003D01CD8F
MSKLLVLSLAETTKDPTQGYAVIAKDLESNDWVIIPTLPKELLKNDEGYAWDIFAVTEADLRRVINNRSDIYEVDTDSYRPYMVSPPVKSYEERKRILEDISNDTINELTASSSWVGILRNPQISNLLFVKRKEEEHAYDPEQTFYWECRLDFHDRKGTKWRYKVAPGVAVKDMRFKAYWRDLMMKRSESFEVSKLKWINYMIENDTYFLIEFYPNDYYGQIAVISGVITIKNTSKGNYENA